MCILKLMKLDNIGYSLWRWITDGYKFLVTPPIKGWGHFPFP